MKTPFVILAGPRSGSTAFRMWLNSHPLIRCHDEVLLKRSDSPDAIAAFYRDKAYSMSFEARALAFPDTPETSKLLGDFLASLYQDPAHPAPWKRLDNIQESQPNTGHSTEKAVGFKFMYYLLDNPFLAQWLSINNVRIIHLIRENMLKQYFSYLAYRQRDIAHSEAEVDAVRLTVDTGSLLQTLSMLSKQRDQIRRRFNGTNCIEVSYESFCRQPETLAEQLKAFLGATPGQMHAPSLKKLNTENLNDLVENYDEVASCIHGTPFQHMLETAEVEP